jgi:hypothetical protein
VPDLDVVRLFLGVILGLSATYFLVPDTDAAPEDANRLLASRPRDLMGEHLRETHRHPVQGCPLCDYEHHGPVG